MHMGGADRHLIAGSAKGIKTRSRDADHKLPRTVTGKRSLDHRVLMSEWGKTNKLSLWRLMPRLSSISPYLHVQYYSPKASVSWFFSGC